MLYMSCILMYVLNPSSSERHGIARSRVTVTRLLCDPLPYKNALNEPHANNLVENTVLAFSTKCTKRSPGFSRVRYSGSGYRLFGTECK
jgi:hypothetical protein